MAVRRSILYLYKGIENFEKKLSAHTDGDAFIECDMLFFETQFEDENYLTELNFNFIMKNRADFI